MKINRSGLVLAFFLSGCGTLGTNSLPVYSNFNIYDEKAVDYMRNVPAVDPNQYVSQSNRIYGELKDSEIMVAVSGGGARAAAFTLGVLAELEQLGRWTSEEAELNALEEVDHFSTISGGGWAVASYITDRKRNNPKDYKLNQRLDSLKNDFTTFGDGNIDCIASEISEHVTKGMKFGEIFSKTDSPEAPYLFSAGAVFPSQSPFVFSQEFINYYNIDDFFACEDEYKVSAEIGFENLDIGYAVATSGSVPAFHHSSASTRMCEDPELIESSFCGGDASASKDMILVDGGIYDNYGYQTGLEILNKIEAKKKVLVVIDSNADTESHFVDERSNDSIGYATSILKTSGFPARTSAFNRILEPVSKAMGVDSVVIDFFAAADYLEKARNNPEKDYLSGLGELKTHAETEISCYADDGRFLNAQTSWKDRILFRNPREDSKEERLSSKDCLSNNFYRSGLMHKTTYLIDDDYFDVLTQLGRLAVRLKADEIYEKMYR